VDDFIDLPHGQTKILLQVNLLLPISIRGEPIMDQRSFEEFGESLRPLRETTQSSILFSQMLKKFLEKEPPIPTACPTGARTLLNSIRDGHAMKTLPTARTTFPHRRTSTLADFFSALIAANPLRAMEDEYSNAAAISATPFSRTHNLIAKPLLGKDLRDKFDEVILVDKMDTPVALRSPIGVMNRDIVAPRARNSLPSPVIMARRTNAVTTSLLVKEEPDKTTIPVVDDKLMLPHLGDPLLHPLLMQGHCNLIGFENPCAFISSPQRPNGPTVNVAHNLFPNIVDLHSGGADLHSGRANLRIGGCHCLF
jgi:hypothetical protein